MLSLFVKAVLVAFKSRTRLIAENLCLRQQLVVLKRRQLRPRLRDSDRRFWIVACHRFARWRETLIIVQPETVLGWHRRGWKAYWRWRSRRSGGGRRRIAPELRALIRRMAGENLAENNDYRRMLEDLDATVQPRPEFATEATE